MTSFATYSGQYRSIRMHRDRGVLEVTLHTRGGSLIWTDEAHRELGDAFGEIGRDADNRVVILTGTGEAFCGPRAPRKQPATPTVEGWDGVLRSGLALTINFLDIPVPVISCLNGPALRHAEIPLLADVVLAADTATIQDSAHFLAGVVPGDGVNMVFPILMGWNRGRYFLLTGQELTAQEARALGLVSEVLPKDALLPRARDLARTLVQDASPAVLRYTRMLFTLPLKQMIHGILPTGLALEGLALLQGRPSAAAGPDSNVPEGL